MKDKRNANRKKFIMRKAQKFMALEEQLKQATFMNDSLTIKVIEKEISDLVFSLDVNDMLEIDEYIISHPSQD